MFGMVVLHTTGAAFGASGARLVPQVAHDGAVSNVMWSADGERIVTVSERNETTCIWYASTGNLLARLEGAAHPRRAFSPDERRIVTARGDEAIVWDVETAAPLFHLRGHRADLYSAQFSPDGRRVLTLTDDHVLIVWDATTGALLRKLDANEWFVFSAEFAPDGRLWSVGHRLDVWDPESGELLRAADDVDMPAGDRRAPKVQEPTPMELGTSLVFSPDGRRFLSPERKRLVVWDATTWKPTATLADSARPVLSSDEEVVRFTPDGRYVIGAITNELVLWDVRTGLEARRIDTGAAILATAVSADGRKIAAVHETKQVTVWEAATGKRLWTLEGPIQTPRAVAFSPDGTRLATGDDNLDTWSWNLETGEPIAVLRTLAQGVLTTALSTDHRSIATATSQVTSVWSAPNGELLGTVEDPDVVFRRVRFAPDGRRFYAAGGSRAWSWTLPDWEPSTEFAGPGADIVDLVVAPNGWLAAIDRNEVAFVWNVDGTVLAQFTGVTAVAFTADSQTLALAGSDGGLRLVGTKKWAVLKEAHAQFAAITQISFSADKTRFVTASADRTATVWDAATGEPLTLLEGHTGALVGADWTPDGQRVVTRSFDGTTRVWNAHTGELLHVLSSGTAFASTFFDGKLLTGNSDGVGMAWDLSSGAEVYRLTGHSRGIREMVAGANHVFTASEDGTTRIWDARTGAERAAMMSFRDRTWAVVDPNGRFDASMEGDIDGLVWVIDGLPYSLTQLREHYYDPGLLSKVLGYSEDPLRTVPDLSSIAPPARPHVIGPDSSGRLELRLEDRGGGIGAVELRLNGSDIGDALATQCPEIAKGVRCTMELSGQHVWVPGATNRVEIEVGNSKNLVTSRGLDAFVQATGTEITDPPDLWVLAVGTGQYAGASLNLSYAAADARKFAQAMRVAGNRGFSPENTHVRVLATGLGDGVDGKPSRESLAEAFLWLQQSDPLDTVVVFLSGHGMSFTDPGGTVDDYFHLLPDAASFADVQDATLRPLRSWSGTELSDALAAVPALKRVVILDTCAAGKVDLAGQERALSSDAIRAHQRARERTGAWLLAGAAADRVSYEASRYGQGVLTYTLIEGIRGPALDDDHQIYVSRLFGYAEDKVPLYAAGIGGVQKPVVRRGSAEDFPIGEITLAEQPQVELGRLRPVVARATVQGEKGRQDPCNLTETLNRALREEANTERGAFVKWETAAAVDAWSLTGYCKVGATMAFTGYLTWNGAGKSVERPIRAKGTDVDALTAALVAKVSAIVSD